MPAKYECSHEMRQFLTELPKCEQHVHLEGTLSPQLLFALVAKHNVTLPDEFPKTPEALKARYDQFSNLDDFLHFYYIGMNVLIDQEDFYQLAWDYLQLAAEQGLAHVEMFFDPQGHLSRNIKFETFLGGFTRAAERAQRELGVSSKMIMCLLRHLPVNDCLDTVREAETYYSQGLIHGLGLDSSEKPFPPALFTECYKQVRDKFPHVGLTAHAGEEGGPEYVSDSLDLLGVTRIDHGVNAYKDELLLRRLAENQTLLTVCPISNLKLRVTDDISKLPLQKFLDANVPFSINSDDPAYFNGYVLDNYVEVHRHFGFSLKTWVKVAKNGIRGSWISDEYKQELEKRADLVYEKFKHLEKNE